MSVESRLSVRPRETKKNISERLRMFFSQLPITVRPSDHFLQRADGQQQQRGGLTRRMSVLTCMHAAAGVRMDNNDDMED